MKKLLFILVICLFFAHSFAQTKTDEKAEAVLKKAIAKLGGEKYLQVKNSIGKGNFTTFKEGQTSSFQAFTDIMAFPNKERTEFKQNGSKYVQTNSGETGWIFDGERRTISEQTKDQIDNFKFGMKTSLDNLLRGGWRGKANLTYAGKREAGIGKRNEVVKLTYEENFSVEYEFSATDFLPVKVIYKRANEDNEELKEEDRYAQFLDIQGVLVPFVVDHYINGVQTSRINYTSIEINKNIPESVFAKPNDIKELKKDLKL
jgi:outer membrane lipoprotein-sorting protein